MGNHRQRRALNHWQKQTVRTLFKGGHYITGRSKLCGHYSRADTDRGRKLLGRMVSSGISDVSVRISILGENPSEEVNHNYERIARNDGF